MSWWRSFFGKDQTSRSVAKPLSLKEQYQRKLMLYSEILTATNAALEIMAQMQVRLQREDYFSPAYIKLNCSIVLDHTRRVIQALQLFTRGPSSDVGPVYARIARQINEEITRTLLDESSLLDLPFEKHTLVTPELMASGIAYPAKQEGLTGALILKAVWGWWPAVQNGMVRARRYQVAADQVTEFPAAESGLQEQWLTYHPGQGFAMGPLPDKFQGQPCLREAEVLKIFRYYHLLQAKYPNLQELEWALGPDREVIILRSLPSGRPSFQDFPDNQRPEPWLYSHGLTIYPGLASGPAFPLDVDHLPENPEVPEQAVLLANKPSLALAPLLATAAALVVETGDPHNHLAFLVRERRLPAIFGVGQDTSQISRGMLVSVDAQRLRVAAGPLETLSGEEKSPGGAILPAAGKLLERLSPWLFSLNADLWAQPPAPAALHSIHDLLYYASEVRRSEMFCLSLQGEVGKKEAVSLITDRLVPIVVIDSGGGLAEERPSVTLEEVRSLPFRAFLDGMLSIPWPKARPLDLKGFISVIGVTSTTPQAEDQLRKISLALLSRDYMNFSLCLGYHASTIEAYIGENLDNNYIRFHYQGGAASLERRVRRLQLIGEILTRLGFSVRVTGDLLDGIQTGDPGAKLLKKIEILGRLEVYTKQMDMVMSDETAVSGYVTDFLEKHCVN